MSRPCRVPIRRVARAMTFPGFPGFHGSASQSFGPGETRYWRCVLWGDEVPGVSGGAGKHEGTEWVWGIRADLVGGLTYLFLALLLGLQLAVPAPAGGQQDEFEMAPIHYSSTESTDPVARLQQRIDSGEVRLHFDERFGYLNSVLEELDILPSSQTLVFSKTSLQRNRIAPRTPRALYFSDDVYIGYCHAGDVLEVSAVDPQLGAVFYTLDQPVSTPSSDDPPQFVREGDSCLICHGGSQTRNIPGHLIRSVFTDVRGFPILSAGSHRIDQTSPFENRWGGWYVTGTHGEQRHRGNLVIRGKEPPPEGYDPSGMNRLDLEDLLETKNYLTPHSDLIALMVLEHQAEAHNMITRANFGARSALHREEALRRALGEEQGEPPGEWGSTPSRIASVSEPLVRYFLYCDEAPLSEPIRGSCSFADDFQQLGPHDSQGRSLRDLDLEGRLMKYPCSYLIYSEAFDGLPDIVRKYVYGRLWEVLSGEDTSPEFSHLSAQDRRNILEILRDTKQDLPDSWE
jgi:hypothetical protein